MLRDFQTAALIGRLPRQVVRTYVVLATASHWLSVEDAEENPDSEFAGAINGGLDHLVRDVAPLLTDASWSTSGLRWLKRVHLRHWRLRSRFKNLSLGSREQIDRASSWTT